MNYRRWLIVGYMLMLMAFTTSVLLIPGQKYDTLTTSDSGWEYDTAVEIDKTNALAENNPLSHAPYGLPIATEAQLQPLVTVMLYRGISTVNPDVTLMDVVKYYAPLIFALSLIPIFLIGRELGGDIGGIAAVFFAATLVSSIYWHKVGAYDREPIQLILGAWSMFLTIKLFKVHRRSIPKFALLTGMVYGLFGLAWAGWHYVIAIMMLGLFLVLLVGFLGKLLSKISDPFGALSHAIRGHLRLLVGVALIMVVITFVLSGLGGLTPLFWTGIFQTYTGYLGLGAGGGGEGVSFTTYASEMQSPNSWGDTLSKFYGADILTSFIIILIGIALIKFLWSRKRWEILTFSWLIVLAAMVLPGAGQARFERMWWPFVPVMAGVGVATLVHLARRFSFEPSGEWLRHFQNPIVLVLVVGIIAAPFVHNAYVAADRTTPPTEWHGRGLDKGFMEAFGWISENTPEDSIVSIQWSFGHLFTGTARRATVVDGAEISAKEGVWENDLTFTPRPPDYIYYVEGNTGRIYGVDAPRKSYSTNLEKWVKDVPGGKPGSFEINGRRIDVQWLPVIGEDEFRWLITTYRDNYGIKIDYVIFAADEYSSAWDYYYTTLPRLIISYAEKIKTPEQLQTSVEGQNYVLDLGENRKEIVLDIQNQSVYLRTDTENLSLDGYSFFRVDTKGKITDYLSFYPPTGTADIQETLLVFLDGSSNIVSAWLVKGVSAKVTGRPVPMVMRVFAGNTGDIDYLQVPFKSSNGLVSVVKINHVPAPTSPENGANTNDNTPEFKWSGAIGASKYKLQVDDDADFSSTVIQEDNLTDRTHTAAALTDGNYSWRVGAYNSTGNFLGWSDVFTFVIDTQIPSQPQLSSPQDGAELTSLAVTFEWTKLESGVTYDIQIDDENDFTSPYENDNTGISDNSYTYTFPRNGVYYWRVQAVDAAGNTSGWPSSFTLTIGAPAQAPTLSSPENGAPTNDNTPTLKWTGGNGDNYRLLLDDDSDFASPNENRILAPSATSYTVATENAHPDGTYSWKVVAIVGSDESPSAVWTFTVDATAPGAPTIVAPENENQTSDATPTFEWTVGSGADNHRLVVDDDSNFGSPVLSVTLGPTDNAYTPPDNLTAGAYWWKVVAVDAAGNSSASPVQLLTVTSPEA